jgi:lipid A 3-O-deacylase
LKKSTRNNFDQPTSSPAPDRPAKQSAAKESPDVHHILPGILASSRRFAGTIFLLSTLVLSLTASVVWADGLLPKQSPLQLAQTKSSEKMGYGILSELCLGVMAHDVGAFGRQEEDGVNANVEFLFVSPELLSAIWSPRPHAGFSVNSSNGTNQAYLGLTWTWEFFEKMYVEGSLGGAYHDGANETTVIGQKSLRCKVLFCESAALGYRVTEKHSLSVMLDHISNAKLCTSNEGLDTLGVRYGYRF